MTFFFYILEKIIYLKQFYTLFLIIIFVSFFFSEIVFGFIGELSILKKK